MKLMKVLIVDDSPLSLKILRESLRRKGLETVVASSGYEAFEKLKEHYEEIAVITLDRELPDLSGEEIAKRIKSMEKYKDIPLIFITSLSSRDDIKYGLEMGVYDYITKPIDSDITYLKVRNAIRYYSVLQEATEREKSIRVMSDEARRDYRKIDELNRRLKEKNKILEVVVEARTKELKDMTHSLLVALEDANLYNDENTGKHLLRVANYSELLGRGAGLGNYFIQEIKLYAPLHDIGKVGISDSLLKKPGRYTKEEFDEMKKHVEIGYKMIKNSPLSDVAKNIVRYHHERWDSTGYIKGLKGEEIPIEARIVAIADVFDALTTKRPYKEAFIIEKALEILDEGKGSHFDPKLLDIFFKNIDSVLKIKEENDDE